MEWGYTVLRDRSQRRAERLGEYLATKYPRRPLWALAEKQVLVYGFDFKVVEQFFQIKGQGCSPGE